MAGCFFGNGEGKWIKLTGRSYMYGGRRRVEFICECGKKKFVLMQSLKSGAVQSCGCRKAALFSKLNKTHGLYNDPIAKIIHLSWVAMKARCYNEKNIGYHNYGLRGISVCDEWREDFECFYKWAVSNGWQKGLTLDKVDNDKGYYPENCRWSSSKQQNRNKRNNINISAFKEVKCIQAWQEDDKCLVASSTLWYRLRLAKWPVEDAISLPPQNGSKRIKKQKINA